MDRLTDYYAILGVEPQASPGAIKAAFKKLALQYHPDVYKGDDAQQRMRTLLEAYQTLNDAQKRREYDARRSGIGLPGHSTATEPRKASADKQSRFVFPDLDAELAAPMSFQLEGIPYTLTTRQAEDLWWNGLLRGTLPLTGGNCYCQRCHYHWFNAVSQTPPVACPSCHARDWNEFFLLRCTHCHAVFASKEMRDPLRENVLYHPYELFPLCPNCRRSQWCESENKRVQALRVAAQRRTILLWGSLVTACLLVTLLVMLLVMR